MNPLRLLRDHPLARGLGICLAPRGNVYRTEVARRLPLEQPAVYGVPSVKGNYFDTTNGDLAHLRLGVYNSLSPISGGGVGFYSRPGFTQIAIAESRAAGNREGWIAIAGGCFFGRGYTDASKVFSYVTGSDYIVEAHAGFFETDKKIAYAVSFNNPTARYFKRGAFVGTGSVAANTPATSDGYLAAAFSSGSSIKAWSGKTYFAGLWNRALSDREVAQVSHDPWQLFERNAFRTYSVPYAAPASAPAGFKPQWARHANTIIQARL